MKKISKAVYLLFPFFSVLSLAALFIESVTYSGFFAKYVLLDAKLIMIFDIALGLFLVMGKNGFDVQKSSVYNGLHSLVFHLSYLFSPVLVLFYYLMVSVETTNYPNFVFSSYHIIPDNFMYLVFLDVYLVVLGVLVEKPHLKALLPKFYNSINDDREDKLINSSRVLLGLQSLIVIFVLSNFAKTSREILKSNIFIFHNLNYSYDQKMTSSWNDFYRFMFLVKKVTPENSVIAIPPSVRPWLSEGNSVLVRYFLYPRKLISPDEPKTQNLTPQYYLLAKGLWKASNPEDYGWPKIRIDSEEIFYFDLASGKVVAKKSGYNPEDLANKDAWGVIKTK